MSEIRTCRCCNDSKLVGHFGLCQDCKDATDRFWTNRKAGFDRQRKQEAARNK